MDSHSYRVLRAFKLSLMAIKKATSPTEEKEKLYEDIIFAFLCAWEDDFSIFTNLINYLLEKEEYKKPAKQALKDFLAYQEVIYGEPLPMFRVLLDDFDQTSKER